jgi:hypothetical protein
LFNRGNKKENGERQVCDLTSLQVLEQLEKEEQLLNDEKKKLLDAEKVLLFMLNEAIEAKTRKNQELRLEVQIQKVNCAELSRVLNTSIEE